MTTAKTQSDRIEKKILLRAPQARVWRALTDATEFGTWFGVKFEGPFRAGKSVKGSIDLPDTGHVTFEVKIERVEPERLFSLRWHPNAVDLDKDYSKEPMTLVEFRLEKAPEGTLLTMVESGFEGIPLGRRDEAFRRNGEGWTIQMENIKRHVGG